MRKQLKDNPPEKCCKSVLPGRVISPSPRVFLRSARDFPYIDILETGGNVSKKKYIIVLDVT